MKKYKKRADADIAKPIKRRMTGFPYRAGYWWDRWQDETGVEVPGELKRKRCKRLGHLENCDTETRLCL